jgi:primary-amine oxidase
VTVALPHPLDPLSAEEIAAAGELARRELALDERVAFVSVALREPKKEDVLSGSATEREAEIVLLDPAAECAYEAVVSLTRGALVDRRELHGLQPAMTPEEYALVERVVKADPDFQAALARRGIAGEQLELVGVDPVPVGAWGDHQFEGQRLIRALSWIAPYPGGNTYARPIEGLVGLVDTHRAEVVSIEDHGVVPIPPGAGEYRAGLVGPFRSDVAPLEIMQPDGPGFTVDGNLVRWQRWQLRVGFTTREGLVLHQVGYEDEGRLRPILYRASFSEMAVPYGDPSPTRYLQSPFDIGENLVGRLANSLELGCDCLGEIRYFDAAVCDSRGRPIVIRNAVCVHEEDAGILWKHWDFRTEHTEVRRSRRLVVSSISTIGNYDYGFFWHFYQDGSIEVEVKATGILSTAACPPGERPVHGQLVAEGLNGMIHQHFFNARLDFDVDGERNAVYEVHTEGEPTGPANPFGNAFRPVRRLLLREGESPQVVDPLSGRYWLVVNHASRNRLGEPVGWKLMPGENVLPFAQPGSALARRGGFAYKHVWVTRYDPSERYAAGDYPYQHPGGAGLPAYVANDRSIEDEDLVLWYTFGLHHLPRPEDWPVMPVASLGFMLKPFGFFDRNPALDVPPPAGHDHRDV